MKYKHQHSVKLNKKSWGEYRKLTFNHKFMGRFWLKNVIVSRLQLINKFTRTKSISHEAYPTNKNRKLIIINALTSNFPTLISSLSEKVGWKCRQVVKWGQGIHPICFNMQFLMSKFRTPRDVDCYCKSLCEILFSFSLNRWISWHSFFSEPHWKYLGHLCTCPPSQQYGNPDILKITLQAST